MCLSLFRLPLPSTAFPFTSGLTCWETLRGGGRKDREGEMTWMATKVEMSFCALYVSGSEISWHLIVPSWFFFLWHQWRTGKHTPLLCPILTAFCPQYESLDSKYSNSSGCQGNVRYRIECYWVSSAILERGKRKASGWICTLQLNASPTSMPSVRHTQNKWKWKNECERARSSNAPWLRRRAGRAGHLLTRRNLFHTNLFTWAPFVGWHKNTSQVMWTCYKINNPVKSEPLF